MGLIVGLIFAAAIIIFCFAVFTGVMKLAATALVRSRQRRERLTDRH